MFLQDSQRNAVKVQVRIADAQLDSFVNSPDHSVDCPISVFFAFPAASPLEELQELLADSFILLSRTLSIVIKLREQIVESILGKRPTFLSVRRHHLQSP